MSEEEFELLCQRISGFTKYIYFHVMGEPLLHPRLSSLLSIARRYGYLVCITTNGTLLPSRSDVLLSNHDVIHRVSISLHSSEGNGEFDEDYVRGAIKFGKELSALDRNVVYRLWNLDTDKTQGQNSKNSRVEEMLKAEYPDEWLNRYSGYRIGYRAFLEYDGVFVWPSESESAPEDTGKCHALRSQIAILADGTVVPCCLDSEGRIPLGNIFKDALSDILSRPLAAEMKKGFTEGRVVHPFCKTCSYRRRFN